jgi:NIMA (never in mitosis gene a)-related kinase
MQSGILKLGDFGIAKVFYDKLPFTESIVGTPLYMSPEIIEGFFFNLQTIYEKEFKNRLI